MKSNLDSGVKKFVRGFQDLIFEATDRDDFDAQVALIQFVETHPDIRYFVEEMKTEAERVLLRWPLPGSTTEWPLSEEAFQFVCRFNGADPEKVLSSWRYAPNEYMQKVVEYWGAQPLDVQMERIKWSRTK